MIVVEAGMDKTTLVAAIITAVASIGTLAVETLFCLDLRNLRREMHADPRNP
jgi:hypothetical protein